MRERDRRAGRAADAEHRDGEPGRVRASRGFDRALIGAVGEHDDVAAMKPGLLDQLLRLGDRSRCVIAGDRHRRRIERIDEIAHGADVVGQRRCDVRFARIADQRGLVVLAAFEDVDDLVARALEAARFFVLRHHRRRELERDHARGLVAIERHRLALPRGARECERCERPERDREHDAGAAGAGIDALDQVRQEMRIDCTAPCAGIGAAAMAQQPEQRNREQQQQP